MAEGIRHRGCVELTLADGDRILFDGVPSALDGGPGVTTVVSHGHGDHLPERPPRRPVCSALTAAVADERQPDDTGGFPGPADDERIELVDAGHVPGSRAARITDPETGTRYLYTGDVRPRPRFFLEGFEPIDADVLVIEATYGREEYRLPPHEEVVDGVLRWLQDTMDRPVLLFGYAFGRAQQLTRLAARAGRRVLVTDAVARLNAIVERHSDVAFSGERYEDLGDLGPGDALVVPMQSGRIGWVEALVERTDAATAGFSGWAVDDSFVYGRGLDRGFPISDHADAEELVAIVDDVDPDRVYTHHGFADALARRLGRRGFDARALKPHQARLERF